VTRRFVLAVALATAALLVAACSGGTTSGSPTGTCCPAGSPTPAPTTLTAGQLRVAIMDRFGPRWWCDTDFYPIAHAEEQDLAIQRFPEMQAEGDVFAAVVARLGLAGKATFSDADKLAIYQLWKAASSFPFDSIGNGRYRFDYLAQPASGAQQGLHVAGTITDGGEITIEQQALAGEPNCPICLARGTPIEAPDGPIAVDRLRLGDPIWTFDADGRRIAGTVIAIGSTPAPAGHHVIELTLADGRTVTASPGHPLADGRPLGDLRIGDEVDGSRVVSLDVLAYDADSTFDLVASGPTGGYFAGGIPMLSTLGP